MIWTGLELLGELPFHDVIITSTILAPDGRRMSKSLGTGIDPLDVIDKHGADATRYGLLKMSSTQDVRFAEGTIEEGRKLANKLWNVARLILAHAEGAAPDLRPRDVEERWILARIDAVRDEVEAQWSAFEFAPSVQALYHLTFDDFCDWYAEAIKPRLRDGRRRRRRNRARRARAAARAAPSRDAARDRGDLVEPPRPHGAADRVAVARAGPDASRATPTRSHARRTRLRRSAAAASSWHSTATTAGSSTPSSARTA